MSLSENIESKIVEMKFDNTDFEVKIAETMNSLTKFKAKMLDTFDTGVSTDAATDGMNELGDATNEVSVKFDAMKVIAVNVLNAITDKALGLGKKIVDGFVQPMNLGFGAYEEKAGAVQTIMNATGKSIDSVNEQLDKLIWYTDETSYNFTDMVNSLGKFTSAGVGLEDSVTAMMGISNWAAKSGQGINEASRAYYNLAQSLATGAVKLQDWKSIENANMATVEFKQTAMDTAVELGMLTKTVDGLYTTLSGNAVSTENFSENLTKDAWFTSDVLVKTLGKYGDYSEEVYKKVEETGLTCAEAMELVNDETLKLGESSFKAAQEAKTFTDAINSVKDAMKSGFAASFEYIFGNYLEAKELWTDLANELYDVFVEPINALNEVLGGWSDLGGRDVLLEGAWNIFNGLISVLNVFKETFQSVFPMLDSEKLYQLTVQFRDFTERIKPSEEQLEKLRKVLSVVFAVIKTGIDLVKMLIDSFGGISGIVSRFRYAGNIITITIESLIRSLTKYAKKVVNFVSTNETLANGLIIFRNSIHALGDVMSSFSIEGMITGFKKVADNIKKAIEKIINTIHDSIQKIVDTFKNPRSISFTDIFNIENWKNGITSFIEKVKDDTANAADAIKSCLHGILDAFSATDNETTTVFTMARDKIAAIAGAIAYMAQRAADAFIQLYDMIANNPVLKAIKETVTTFFTTLFTDITNAITEKSLKPLNKELQFLLSLIAPVEFYMIAKALLEIWGLVKAGMGIIKNINTILDGIGQILLGFPKLLKVITKSIKNLQSAIVVKEISQAILSIIIAITTLTAVMVVAEKLGVTDKVWLSIATVFGFLALLLAMVAEMSKQAYDTDTIEAIGKAMLGIAGTVASLFGGIAVMAVAVAVLPIDKLKELKWAILEAMSFVVAVIGSMMVLMDSLANVNNVGTDSSDVLDSLAKVFLSSCVSILGMSKAIEILSRIDNTRLNNAAAVVGGTLVVITACAWAMAQIIKVMNNQSTALTSGNRVLGDFDKMLLSFAAITASILVVAKALEVVSRIEQPWEAFRVLIMTLWSVLTVFGVFVYVMSKAFIMTALDMVALSGAVFLLSAAVFVFTKAIKEITTLNWSEALIGMGKAIVSMIGLAIAASIALAAFEVIMGALKVTIGPGMLLAAGSMVLIAVALNAIYPILKLMTELDSTKLEIAANTFMKISAGLGLLGVVAGLFGGKLVLGAVGLVAVSAAILVFVAAGLVFNAILASTVSMIGLFADAIVYSADRTMEVMDKWIEMGQKFAQMCGWIVLGITAVGGSLMIFSKAIGDGISYLIFAVTIGVQNSAYIIVETFEFLIGYFTTIIMPTVYAFLSRLGIAINALMTSITPVLPQITTLAVLMIAGTAAAAGLAAAIAKIISALTDYKKASYDIDISVVQKSFEDVIKYLKDTLKINGNKSETFKEIANACIASFVETFETDNTIANTLVHYFQNLSLTAFGEIENSGVAMGKTLSKGISKGLSTSLKSSGKTKSKLKSSKGSPSTTKSMKKTITDDVDEIEDVSAFAGMSVNQSVVDVIEDIPNDEAVTAAIDNTGFDISSALGGSISDNIAQSNLGIQESFTNSLSQIGLDLAPTADQFGDALGETMTQSLGLNIQNELPMTMSNAFGTSFLKVGESDEAKTPIRQLGDTIVSLFTGNLNSGLSLGIDGSASVIHSALSEQLNALSSNSEIQSLAILTGKSIGTAVAEGMIVGITGAEDYNAYINEIDAMVKNGQITEKQAAMYRSGASTALTKAKTMSAYKTEILDALALSDLKNTNVDVIEAALKSRGDYQKDSYLTKLDSEIAETNKELTQGKALGTLSDTTITALEESIKANQADKEKYLRDKKFQINIESELNRINSKYLQNRNIDQDYIRQMSDMITNDSGRGRGKRGWEHDIRAKIMYGTDAYDEEVRREAVRKASETSHGVNMQTGGPIDNSKMLESWNNILKTSQEAVTKDEELLALIEKGQVLNAESDTELQKIFKKYYYSTYGGGYTIKSSASYSDYADEVKTYLTGKLANDKSSVDNAQLKVDSLTTAVSDSTVSTDAATSALDDTLSGITSLDTSVGDLDKTLSGLTTGLDSAYTGEGAATALVKEFTKEESNSIYDMVNKIVEDNYKKLSDTEKNQIAANDQFYRNVQNGITTLIRNTDAYKGLSTAEKKDWEQTFEYATLFAADKLNIKGDVAQSRDIYNAHQAGLYTGRYSNPSDARQKAFEMTKSYTKKANNKVLNRPTYRTVTEALDTYGNMITAALGTALLKSDDISDGALGASSAFYDTFSDELTKLFKEGGMQDFYNALTPEDKTLFKSGATARKNFALGDFDYTKGFLESQKLAAREKTKDKELQRARTATVTSVDEAKKSYAYLAKLALNDTLASDKYKGKTKEELAQSGEFYDDVKALLSEYTSGDTGIMAYRKQQMKEWGPNADTFIKKELALAGNQFFKDSGYHVTMMTSKKYSTGELTVSKTQEENVDDIATNTSTMTDSLANIEQAMTSGNGLTAGVDAFANTDAVTNPISTSEATKSAQTAVDIASDAKTSGSTASVSKVKTETVQNDPTISILNKINTNIDNAISAAKSNADRQISRFETAITTLQDNVMSKMDVLNSDNKKYILNLRGHVDNLKTAFDNMGVYIDKKALVGEIATDIDYQLGSFTKMSKRGV